MKNYILTRKKGNHKQHHRPLHPLLRQHRPRNPPLPPPHNRHPNDPLRRRILQPRRCDRRQHRRKAPLLRGHPRPAAHHPRRGTLRAHYPAARVAQHGHPRRGSLRGDVSPAVVADSGGGRERDGGGRGRGERTGETRAGAAVAWAVAVPCGQGGSGCGGEAELFAGECGCHGCLSWGEKRGRGEVGGVAWDWTSGIFFFLFSFSFSLSICYFSPFVFLSFQVITKV